MFLRQRQTELEYEYFALEDQERVPNEDIDQLVSNLQLCEAIEGHVDYVNCLAEIKGYLASGSEESTVRLWDTQTKRQVGSLQGHTYGVKSLAKVKGYLASGSSDSTIRLWDVHSKRQVALFKGHNDIVSSLAEVKGYLASGSADKTVRLWDIETKKQLAVLQGHSDNVNSLTEIKGYLASGSEDSTIRLWDVESKQQVAVLEGHSNRVTSLAKIQGYLASGSTDKTIRLWEVESKRQVGIIKGHTHWITSLTEVKGYLASGSMDNTIRVWDVESKTQVAILEGHTNYVWSLAEINGYLASGSWDKTIRLWDCESRQQLSALEERSEHVNALVEVKRYLASGSRDKKIRLWSVESKKQVAVLEGHTEDVRSLAVIKGYLASGSMDNTVRIWDVESKRQVTILKGRNNRITSLAAVRGYLAAGSMDKKIGLWNIDSKRQVAVLEGHSNSITSLAEINGYLASGSEDKTIRLWNVKTKQQVAILEGHTGDVNSLIEVNGYLASGSYDRTIRLWNVETKEQVAIFEGHSNRVTSLAKVHGYLASGSYDKTVKLWDVETKQQVANFEGHSESITCLAEINGYLASGSRDKTIGLEKMTYKYRFLPGSNIGMHSFKTLANSNVAQYHKSANEVTIMPQRINMLHVLAHQGRDKTLEKALEAGCHFIESRSGRTPLTISLDKKDKRCTEVILRYIANLKDRDKQKNILSRIQKDLPRVLETNSAYLHPLCEAATSSLTDSIRIKNLPEYIKAQAPIVKFSESFCEPKDVRMGRTKFNFNFLEGSRNSLKLIKTLENIERSECLRSDFVQTLVGYKWNKFIWEFWALASLNLLNILLIMGITFSESTTTRELLMVIFLLNNIFFTLFEVLQVFSLKKEYFYSSKNWLDMVRLSLGFALVVVSLVSGFDNFNSSSALTLLTSLLFWVEGISAFKIFESTRYYIWLIQEVIRDIRGFLGILFYFVVAYCAMIGTTTNSSFLEILKTSYDVLLGEFEGAEYDNLQWVVFMLGSLLNLVIMLNLLISIISDSFDRINFEKKESDTRIRLKLIIEVENCLFWRRNKAEMAYLYFVHEYGGEEPGEEEWESRVRKLHNDTEVVKHKVEENSREIKEVSEKVGKILEILQASNYKPIN